MPPHLSVIVLHHRTPELLERCLERLRASTAAVSITVVDTGPGFSTRELLGRASGDVEVIGAPNHSMAGAINTGLKAVRTPFVGHMNADVMVEPDTFTALLGVLQEPGIGMVGPRCLTPHGRPQDQGLPYRRFYRRLARSRSPSVAVPWLSGCLQVVRREAVAAAGGLDSSLRFYNEDMEWCWRLRGAGYGCHLVRTDVLHLGGSSTPNRPAFLIEGYRGGYRLSQRYRGRLFRTAHRAVVLAEARWQALAQREPQMRDAYRQIARMFRQQRFEESPFGGSLEEDNPAFGARGSSTR